MTLFHCGIESLNMLLKESASFAESKQILLKKKQILLKKKNLQFLLNLNFAENLISILKTLM
jgi:hypothetical protein